MYLSLIGLGVVIGVKRVRRLIRKMAILYAIIDVYSRMIVGWGLYTTLEAKNAREVLEQAVANYVKP